MLESLLEQQRAATAAAAAAAGVTPSDNANTDSLQLSSIDAEEAETSDLPSKAGMLCANASGAEPAYFGSSSAFTFSRLIHACLRDDLPQRPLKRAHPGGNAPSPCPLPDYEAGLVLSNAYFDNIHLQYPFLHEVTFRTWEKQVAGLLGDDEGSSQGPVPLFFVYMVYAIGALLVPRPSSSPQGLYVSALLYVDHVFSLRSMEAIQGILCCAMYSLRSSSGPSIWYVIAKHIAGHLLTGVNQEAVWARAPPEIDAEFPVDSITLDESGDPSGDMSSRLATSTVLGKHFFRLRCIWGGIHDALFSNVTTSPLEYKAHQTSVGQLRAELNVWLSTAAPPPPRTGPEISIFPSQEWYRMAYNETILLLYRGLLSDSEGTPDSVFLECMQAAEALCQTYRRKYLGSSIGYTWQAVHALFLAGLTYLHCLWACPAARDATRYDDASAMFTSCTMLLAIMAERWEGAEPYRDIFEVLSRRALRMMVDTRSGETASQAASSGALDAGDMSQWLEDMAGQGLLDGFDSILSDLLGDFNPQDPELFSTGSFS
ncbi:hypothetical protein CEP51_016261 [Fusarium floridanum]|uniref:Xylanolytic transcriptional activator regulatory domain-containing protein n=1 Tax=Fusarium floridanum TaxID=1325733 RepID=A0A428NTS1_9HYPO|nr:hypothetical protein CEP51_016261 [Fusarium floridanum]